MTTTNTFISREGVTTIYSEIHNAILEFPGNSTEYHAKKLQVYDHDFERIAKAITKWPNTYWGMGPFKKTDDGWFIDYENSPMKNISCEGENKILRLRVKQLEVTVRDLKNDNNLLVEKLEKGYEKLKSIANHSMSGWNGVGVIH